MAGPITEVLTAVVDELRAAGVAADTDPRNLNLPAVWVTLDGLDLTRLAGDAGTVRVALTAIVPDAGPHGTLDHLDQLVDTIGQVYPGLVWDVRGVVMPSQASTPLPALYTTLTLEWRRTP